MGLLDGLLGNVLGGVLGGGQQQGGSPLDAILGRLGGAQPGSSGAMGGAGASAMMALAFQLLQQNGGISGMVDKLRASGLGQHADSWVGGGPNMPVSADQLKNALGSGQLGQLASQLGMSTDQAAGGLSQLLPELVNHLTPSGQVPDDQHSLISDALAALTPKSSA